MSKSICSYCLKAGVTLLLVLFIVFGFVREIKSGRFKDRSFVQMMIAQRGRVRSKAKAVTLNQFMPRDFSLLADACSLAPEEVDPAQFAEFVNYYTKVVEYLPRLADGHNLLGVSLALGGQASLSARSFQIALALSPGIASFSYNLALIYFRAGDHTAAVPLLRQALSSRPHDNMKYVSSSRLLLVFLQNDPDPAGKISEIVKKNYEDAYRLLIMSLLNAGQPAAALQTASEALTSGVGGLAAFLYYSGVACFQMKDYDRAVGFLRATLESESQWPEAYYYLGLAMREKGLDEAGVNILQEASRLHMNNGPTRELVAAPGYHLF